MKNFSCRISISDDIDAENAEKAKESFLRMVDEMGVENWVLPDDVECEEKD